MDLGQVIGFALALLLMLVGVAGSILPGLPGTPWILLTAIGHRLCFGAHGASNAVLGLLVVLTLLPMVGLFALSVWLRS